MNNGDDDDEGGNTDDEEYDGDEDDNADKINNDNDNQNTIMGIKQPKNQTATETAKNIHQEPTNLQNSFGKK